MKVLGIAALRYLEGASSALDIERSDIDGTLYPYSGDPHAPALVLFDDVPVVPGM